jgi:hypothetical protein
VIAIALSAEQPRRENARVAAAAARAKIRLTTPAGIDRAIRQHDRSGRLAGLVAAAPSVLAPEIPFRTGRPRARYRFLFGPTEGKIKHSGTLSERDLRRLGSVEPVAIGEIVADGATANAALAHVTEGYRKRAERHLRRWAELDGWRLKIEPALGAIGRRIYREGGHSVVAGPYYANARFHWRAETDGGGLNER